MKTKSLEYIGPLKLLLIFGVVLIHCNIAEGEGAYTNFGLELSNYISGGLCLACVPAFYIISGYLFFRGVENFTLNLYAQKLRRRVSTLLIPYLLWNIISAILFIAKVKLLGFDGLDIIDETSGNIDILRFIQGFWMIPAADDFPFAFAFWFIRNLLCFVVVSPLVYIIARSGLLTLLLLALCLVLDQSVWGAEYFIIGAYLSLHNIDLKRGYLAGWRLTAVMVIYLLATAAILVNSVGPAYLILKYIIVGAGFITFLNAAFRITDITTHSDIGSKLLGATFFIYAFHQCFCRMARKLWLTLIGDTTAITAIITYSMCFLSMVGLSYGVWLLMRRFAPKLLAILTGNR